VTDKPGLLRLMAQEGQRQPSGVVRDIQDKLDAALANGHDPDDGVLALPGVVSETGLKLPDGLSFEQWQSVGFTLKRINRAWRWWVGDWLHYGEQSFGEMASQVMDELGTDYQQLANCAYVSGKIPFSRRRESLSWSHHYEVASVPPAQAENLLDQAEANGWSRNELRAAVTATKTNGVVPVKQCSCHCHTGQACKCNH
jgi:hypothetical protein